MVPHVLTADGLVLDTPISLAPAADVICSSSHSQGWSCVTLPTVSWSLWSAFSSACLRRCCCRASLSCVGIGRFSRLWPLCLFSCCCPAGGEWNYVTPQLSYMDVTWMTPRVCHKLIKEYVRHNFFSSLCAPAEKTEQEAVRAWPHPFSLTPCWCLATLLRLCAVCWRGCLTLAAHRCSLSLPAGCWPRPKSLRWRGACRSSPSGTAFVCRMKSTLGKLFCQARLFIMDTNWFLYSGSGCLFSLNACKMLLMLSITFNERVHIYFLICC